MFDSSLRHQIKGPDSQESGLFYWRWAGEEMQSNSFSSRGLSRADADFDDRHQSLERASNSNTSQLTLSAFSTTPCSSQLTPHLPRHTAQKFACRISAEHGKFRANVLRKDTAQVEPPVDDLAITTIGRHKGRATQATNGSPQRTRSQANGAPIRAES